MTVRVVLDFRYADIAADFLMLHDLLEGKQEAYLAKDHLADFIGFLSDTLRDVITEQGDWKPSGQGAPVFDFSKQDAKIIGDLIRIRRPESRVGLRETE